MKTDKNKIKQIGLKLGLKPSETESLDELAQRLVDLFASFYSQKENAKRIYCHIKPAKSGMSRKIYFEPWLNYTLNALYHQKKVKDMYEYVQIRGCGMDLLWHLLNQCATRATENENPETRKQINHIASYITIVLG